MISFGVLFTINFIGVLVLGYQASQIYCGCSENSGINHVGWSGIKRISGLNYLDDQGKDQIFQTCELVCRNSGFPKITIDEPQTEYDDQNPSNISSPFDHQEDSYPAIIYDDDCFLDDQYLD